MLLINHIREGQVIICFVIYYYICYYNIYVAIIEFLKLRFTKQYVIY